MMKPDADSLSDLGIWEQYCETLKRAGQQIFRPGAPTSDFDRAEGFRYLTRLIRIALEMHVEHGDPDFPTFMHPSHETGKIGSDNPDNIYLSTRLDGRNEYRVSGQRGEAVVLNFATKKGGYANRDCRMGGSGFLDANQMQFNADGSFELILSQKPHSGNWLPMDDDTNQLLVRETFLDRTTQQPARISIERIGAGPQPQPLDPAKFPDMLLRAGRFVENTARTFADWALNCSTRVNQLAAGDQSELQASGGDPNIYYYLGYWSLAEDEALVVDVERIPDCDFWNFQVNNFWMESLDYRYHRIHLNNRSASRNQRGGVTMIVAHRDPGLPNWLETTGHRLGTMNFRWIGAQEHVQPTTRVVKLDELATWT